MRAVVNALQAGSTSLGVVTENLLGGWDSLGTEDDLHLVLHAGVRLHVPDSVTVHAVGGPRAVGMELRVPSLCRRLRADVMLGVTPATTFSPLPCPRAAIAHDLRYRHRPEQFPPKIRSRRRASYAVGYHQADAIVCVSHRTRDDLLEAHDYLRTRPVTVAQLGSDHVLAWGPRVPGPDYALAFGQFGNKNVGLVLDAWARLRGRQEGMPLVVVGVPGPDRTRVVNAVGARGLGGLVTVRPWLSTQEFQQQFRSAALVVFPSDYEGLGLPAIEAMRLGIPLVITPDPALLEVTGGLATVTDGWDADALARAVPLARGTSARGLERCVQHASGFTWRRTAGEVRAALATCIG